MSPGQAHKARDAPRPAPISRVASIAQPPWTRVSPSRGCAAVTPSDAADLRDARAIYVGVGGDLKLTTVDGDTVEFRSLPSGSILPVSTRRVWRRPDRDDRQRDRGAVLMRLSLGIGPSLSRHDLPPSGRSTLRQSTGYSTTAPSGLVYSRASSAGTTVQTGTSSLVACPTTADVLRFGRALDAWDVGLVQGPRTVTRITSSNDFRRRSSRRLARCREPQRRRSRPDLAAAQRRRRRATVRGRVGFENRARAERRADRVDVDDAPWSPARTSVSTRRSHGSTSGLAA